MGPCCAFPPCLCGEAASSEGLWPLGLTEQAHTACSSPCRAGVCSFFFTTLSLFTCQIQSVCVAEFILNELNITKFIYFKMSKFSQSRFY